MIHMHLDFTKLKGDYSIYQFRKDSIIPDWMSDSAFYSVTRTQKELSIVCKHTDIKTDPDLKIDKHWRILKINGTLDLSLIGIIAEISNLFKENKISVFVISTFETDYFLIKDYYIDEAITLLKNHGHTVSIEK
jgi:uncharacterized protein